MGICFPRSPLFSVLTRLFFDEMGRKVLLYGFLFLVEWLNCP